MYARILASFLSSLHLSHPLPPPLTPQDDAQAAAAERVVDLVNAERADNGCRVPLVIDRRLASAAQSHSKNMDAGQFFAHEDPEGRHPWDRMEAAGYRYRLAAENIGAGFPTAERMVEAWMNSPGHRANILNCELTETGVGYVHDVGAHYRDYWTQDFGRPAS